MSIERRVREIYERRPYPPPKDRLRPTWTLPAVEWINALRETRGAFRPKRILIAGCGVGTEAFTIAKRFEDAEVVGVDFSKRSIATANRLRPGEFRDRVRFVVGDLTAADLAGKTGIGFDLVSCHGVLSYIPDAAAVLRNFTRVLTDDGILLLGVNGASHPSVRFRQMLPTFGIEPEVFADNDRVRDVLRIFDCYVEWPPLPMATRDAGLLAGDIFGPLNNALTLLEWTSMLDSARLHLLGTYHAYYLTRSLFNHDLHLRTMPRTRREMSELADAMQPASFHQIVASKRAAAPIPWLEPKQLLRWRPVRTRLFTFKWPRGTTAPHSLREVILKSPATRTKVQLKIPQWEVAVLRQADGTRSLRELLATTNARVAPKALAEAMYLLYLMDAINVLEPERS